MNNINKDENRSLDLEKKHRPLLRSLQGPKQIVLQSRNRRAETFCLKYNTLHARLVMGHFVT